MPANPSEFQVHAAVAHAAREHSGRLLALLIRDLRDFHLAQDCLQDALESAVVHWSRNSLPHSPEAWLLQTARRKAIDRIRRMRNFERLSDEYARLLEFGPINARARRARGDTGRTFAFDLHLLSSSH